MKHSYIAGALAIITILIGTVLTSPLVLRDIGYVIEWWSR